MPRSTGRTGRGHRQQADIIRLLLLTGCRRGEIVDLQWSEVHGDALVLGDSKTGPRKVPLGTEARRILERQPRTESPFVFPSPLDPSRPRGRELALWYRVRKEAGIEDARLHDLRHTHASHAVMNGVPVPVVSRMLGHSNVRMTLRYAHLADRDIEAAAEPRRAGDCEPDGIGHSTTPPGRVKRQFVRVELGARHDCKGLALMALRCVAGWLHGFGIERQIGRESSIIHIVVAVRDQAAGTAPRRFLNRVCPTQGSGGGRV